LLQLADTEPAIQIEANLPSAKPYKHKISAGDAELYYQWGVHEIGPNYGPRYVATKLALAECAAPLGTRILKHVLHLYGTLSVQQL
jgi:hypothetical protein